MMGGISIRKADLASALGSIKGVVERRNTIPILSNVKIIAQDGQLHLTATDLDIMATVMLPAEGNLATTVPAYLLHDIVKKLPDGAEVGLDVNEAGTGMKVFSGRSRFSLQCLPVSDFPDLSSGETPHRFRISGTALKDLLTTCKFCISNEETRYYLNGIYLHAITEAGDSTLCAVATDGHRLAKCEIHAPEGCDAMPGIIIPKKMIGELIKLCDGAGEVEISLSDSKFIAETGTMRLVSKLIDGTFPDYVRVIPTGNRNLVTVNTKAFSAAADRVSTISSERGRAVKLEFGPDRIELAVRNPDSGEATEEVAASLKGDPVSIGFNAAYLTEVLAHINAEEAQIALADSGSPTLFTNPADASRLFVLMPMWG